MEYKLDTLAFKIHELSLDIRQMTGEGMIFFIKYIYKGISQATTQIKRQLISNREGDNSYQATTHINCEKRQLISILNWNTNDF